MRSFQKRIGYSTKAAESLQIPFVNSRAMRDPNATPLAITAPSTSGAATHHAPRNPASIAAKHKLLPMLPYINRPSGCDSVVPRGAVVVDFREARVAHRREVRPMQEIAKLILRRAEIKSAGFAAKS
jgi:hypothetical protein